VFEDVGGVLVGDVDHVTTSSSPAPTGTAPGQLLAATPSLTSIILTWGAADPSLAQIDHYNIYRTTGPSIPPTKIGSTPSGAPPPTTAVPPTKGHTPPSRPDPPGTFRTDASTVLTVPRNGAQPIATTYWLKTDATSATYQLMSVDGASGVDVPVVDHVVALAFEYFGDPQPPLMRKPLADATGPWTTYGPKPATAAVAPFAPGENCIFANDGSGTPQPRLTTLNGGASLVALTAPLLTDGPWCPSDTAPDRWDADLLRVRSIAVRLRVQAALTALRGPASALFAHVRNSPVT